MAHPIDHQHLDACVRGLRNEMVDFTSELVAHRVREPSGPAYPDCVRAIESRLRALGLPCEVVKYRPAKGYARRLRRRRRAEQRRHWTTDAVFSGHYDVVPVTTPGQCAPVLRGKTLFGRGIADMKSGLASMLYAAVALQRLRVPLDGRVGLVFVPDEETGGRRGSGFLAATKRLGADGIGMLTPEPTSGVVWNANRGAITVRVTVHGREAHVGLLHQGRNAFEDAMRVVAGLQALARRVGRRRTRFRVTPDAARRSLMLIGGRVEAGSDFNVVPGRCVFTVDRRMNPEEDFEAEREALFAVFAEARRAGVKLDVETSRRAGRRDVGGDAARSRPQPPTSGRSPAGRRSSRCARACWRSGSTPSRACRPTPTVQVSSRSRTGPRSSCTPTGSSSARRSMRAWRRRCSSDIAERSG